MSIVISGQDSVVEQARRQLEDLVPVWAVLDYTDTRVISRELLLVKVSILGPEYLEDQFVGGPSHEPRRSSPHAHAHTHAPPSVSSSSASKAEREALLAHNFERSGHPETVAADPPPPLPLTASEALRLKHQYLQSISVLADQFGAKIVDVSDNSVIVELTAKTTRVVAFLNLLKPFGILESARTGLMAMPRTPIARPRDDADDISEEGGAVDASLLPPG
ncbi:acetolactate synthase [Imleria badia]|nr:acetolactate synthase [Imleria badia]